MKKMLGFVVSMAAANVLGGLIMSEIMMKRFMNKAYIKDMVKMSIEAGEELTEELMCKDEDEES